MSPRKAISYLFIIGFLCVVILNPTKAQQFASFSSDTSGVFYVNGVLAGDDLPIIFNFNAHPTLNAPSIGYNSINAILSFTATPVGAAQQFGMFGVQDFQLSSFTILGASGSVADGQLLLGGTVDPVQFSGTIDTTNATLSATMSNGSSFLYTSDFLTFPPGDNASLNWGFSSLAPPFSVNNGGINSFVGNISSGSFSDTLDKRNQVVPEPGTVSLLCAIGVTLIGARVLRKRISRI